MLKKISNTTLGEIGEAFWAGYKECCILVVTAVLFGWVFGMIFTAIFGNGNT